MDGGDQNLAANRPSNDMSAIVAIGASAGGVQALQTLFQALPSDSGASFVVVVHLDPKANSDLPRILASRTRMRVVQVEGTTKLEPDCVYVIPPDRQLQITDHELSTSAFDEPRGLRTPIDLLFRSLADQIGDGLAVILTGAGSDGAIGVRAVKGSGGIILVQDPLEAQYPSMPRSAIATGAADFVLPVRELAHQLAELIKNKRTIPVEPPDLDEELLRRVLAHLHVRTGHDFANYKRTTVLRRIARRMQVTHSENLQSYYEYLRDNADESQALLSDFLISVTTFFRDKEAFEILKKDVLPNIFQLKDARDPIRVWVAGCATGEEAYTIAMLLLEEAARHEIRLPMQVFASDLDSHAVSVAREGRYPAVSETEVSEERLRRFFVREGDFYHVRQELRDLVLFATHSLLKDPPFSRVDLISCRNLLIYLDRDLQEQVLGTLYYALNPGGYLLLGSSETADNPPGLFRSVDRNVRIYQSTAHAGEQPRVLPRLLTGSALHTLASEAASPRSAMAAAGDAAAHRRALESIAPPSILVDRGHRVVHLSDNAGRYMQPSGGPLSGDAVDLVRPELRFELRAALHRAFEQGRETLSMPIRVRFNGAARRMHLLVRPAVADGNAADPQNALVLFMEGEAVEANAAGLGQQQAPDASVGRLTEELELTRARLRTMREESEAANEELRAANEELQSINEEYRSTSEELETSKEELQSINEELQTVNSELKIKLEVVSRAHSDLQNLMAATEVGTLFLDPSLRIKRFTEHVTSLFSLTPADEGRPITDFAHQLEYDDLVDDARAVLADLAPIRREIHSATGAWYDIRLRPYRTVDDKIDGVVITFMDVSERRGIEERLRERERLLAQLKRLVDFSRDAIFFWDPDAGITEWNRGSEELYGYTPAEALGKRPEQLLRTLVPGSSFEEMRAKLVAEGSWSGTLTQRTKNGQTLTVNGRLQLDTLDGRRLVLASVRDVEAP